jgi:uncharacterized glyoxalase superfamily protein PhnB
MADDILLPADAVPNSGGVLNSFVIVDDAAGFLEFVTEVFGVSETKEARADMPDGKIIHSEIRMGGNDLMPVDRLEGWPLRPGLLQVWVEDVGVVLDRATARGAEVVTGPTPFWGETTLARMIDRWQNIWWLWAPAPGQAGPEHATDDESDGIFESIDQTLRALGSAR